MRERKEIPPGPGFVPKMTAIRMGTLVTWSSTALRRQILVNIPRTSAGRET
ncbi:MAG TPA: hypothetical protein VL523_13185 [Terriglobia bacterium]|nr:hypothetical protein [Terriglobia bacterium]